MSQPDYKNTVSSWLGEVPAAWEVRRLKTLIAQPITDGPHETPEFLPDGIPFLSVDGIQNGDLVFDGCRYISQAAYKEYQKKCAPRYNDILIGKAASTGKIARVKVDFDFGVWSPLALIRPRPQTQPGFLEYALKNVATQAQIDCLCTANTQKNISMRDIPSLVLCVPPTDEQRRIAAYLDEQTAKIDRLMELRRRQMSLLKEQRAALIQQAVTRGLNPNAPMKDSGLPWVEQTPKNWMIASVNARYEVQLGKMLDTARIKGNCLAPYLRNVDVQWDCINVSDLPLMDFAPRDRTKFSLRAGDLLVCEGGEVGRAAIWNEELPNCFYQKAIHRLRPRTPNDNPRFMFYLLLIASTRGLFSSQGGQATIEHLPAEALRRYRFPFAPRGEQDNIVEFIDTHTAKFDALHAAYARQLTLLAEYRASLIHECVTGQRPVPEPSSQEANAHAL